MSAGQVIGSDCSAAEISDQQMIAVEAEACGSKGYAPRSVQPAAVIEALKQISVGVEYVDASQSGTVLLVGTISLFGESHIQSAADVLDVEGRKPARQFVIDESAGNRNRSERPVINLDLAAGEVRGIEQVLETVIGHGEPFVDVCGLVAGAFALGTATMACVPSTLGLQPE